MSTPPIYYFDNNATTRVAPEVVDAMLPFLREYWGNPSSTYAFGRQLGQPPGPGPRQGRRPDQRRAAGDRLHQLRHRKQQLGPPQRPGHPAGQAPLLTTAVEHSANIKFCDLLQKQGYTVTFLPVAPDGALDLQRLEESIRPDTAIVSVMWANNETGVLFPVREIAAICRRKGALVPHRRRPDARQAED